MTGGSQSSALATLSVGAPQDYEPGLEVDGFAAGQGCELDTSDGDAVLPFQLTVANTSSSSSNVGFTIDGVGDNSIPGITGPMLEAETNFSDSGDTCDDESTVGVQSTQAIGSGQDVVISGFFDITEYSSGAATESAILDDTLLTIATTNGPDADGSYTVDSVAGPGVIEFGSGWEFDLAGTTPQD
jgi:hypothetical protein